MIQENFFDQFIAQLVEGVVAICLVFLFFNGIKWLFDIGTFNIDAILYGLSERSNSLEVLLIAVDHILESLFCLLLVFCQANVCLLLRQLLLLFCVLVIILKIIQFLCLFGDFLLLTDHISS